MIDLVTAENRHLFKPQLQQMWRQRHYVFIEKFGWDLNSSEGMEIDEFDTVETKYLIATLDDRNVAGSVRLLPTTQPHLMSEIFPHLCNGVVPTGPDIWEVSRHYNMPPRADQRPRVGGEIMAGLLEFGLLFGIERFTLVSNMFLMPRVLAAGWDVTPLGLPVDYQGEAIIALSVSVTPAGLQALRHKRGISGPVIRYERSAVAA